MIEVDVVWFREKYPTWKTKIILWGSGRPYSHVALIGKATDGKEYIFHAVGQGVLHQLASEYVNDERWIVKRKKIQLTCSQDRLEGYVLGESGKDYSETQLAVLTLARFLKMKWAMKFWYWLSDGNRERICSEIVYAVILLWSTIPCSSADIDFVTPGDLDDLLKPETIDYPDLKIG